MLMGHGFTGDPRNHFQRIDIEEPLSIQLHSGQDRIVKNPLHHIGINSLHFIFQHSGGKKHQTDGSTGFCIGGIVRKVIILRKGFPKTGRTDTTG